LVYNGFRGLDLKTSTPVALGDMEQASNVRQCGRSMRPVRTTDARAKLHFCATVPARLFIACDLPDIGATAGNASKILNVLALFPATRYALHGTLLGKSS